MKADREELHRFVDELPEGAVPVVKQLLAEYQDKGLREGFVSRGATIEHVGMWVGDLEKARAFYERWFHAEPGPVYSSARRPFRSYFMSFGQGARLEIMTSPDEPPRPAHVALTLGSRRAVDLLFMEMKTNGIPTVSEPRQTGDGYYEAVIADCDGNLVEITG